MPVPRCMVQATVSSPVCSALNACIVSSLLLPQTIPLTYARIKVAAQIQFEQFCGDYVNLDASAACKVRLFRRPIRLRLKHADENRNHIVEQLSLRINNVFQMFLHAN